jgi:hypothetical protein
MSEQEATSTEEVQKSDIPIRTENEITEQTQNFTFMSFPPPFAGQAIPPPEFFSQTMPPNLMLQNMMSFPPPSDANKN